MQPTQNDVHVNALMTQFSLMYAQELDGFVADKVFPLVPVSKASDRYLVYDRADFNRNDMKVRANSTESAGTGYKIDTTPTYSVDNWALHRDIDDNVRRNADAILNLDAEATRFLTNKYLISREVNWSSAFFTTGIWTTGVTGVASAPAAGTSVLQWNDDNSSPIKDIRYYKRVVQLASGGFRPNKLVLGRPVFDVLCDHPDFIDRIKYGQTPGAAAKVTRDAMAALFELDEVLVMDGILNTGIEGTAANANEVNQFIGGASGVGGKGCLLCYTPSAPGLMTPAAGYCMSWTGGYGNNVMGSRILSYYIQQIKSTRVEMEADYVFKKVGADMGAYFTTVIA